MKVTPNCKVCLKKDGLKVLLAFHSFGSMSSSHSNIYECTRCGRKVEIYDSDLEIVAEKSF